MNAETDQCMQDERSLDPEVASVLVTFGIWLLTAVRLSINQDLGISVTGS